MTIILLIILAAFKAQEFLGFLSPKSTPLRKLLCKKVKTDSKHYMYLKEKNNLTDKGECKSENICQKVLRNEGRVREREMEWMWENQCRNGW